MYEITATTTISASPEQVWSILDDIRGWPNWMPSTKNLRIEELTPGPPREGYRFRFRGKIAWAIMEVVTFTPLERMTKFHLNVPPLRGTNRCLLVPLDHSRYRIERVDRLILPGTVIRFLDRTQRSRFEKLAAEFLYTLKQAVEKSSSLAKP